MGYFNIMNCQVIFHKGGCSSYSHWPWITGIFLVFAYQLGEKCFLILMFVSLTINKLRTFIVQFAFPILQIIFANPLTYFSLGLLIFYFLISLGILLCISGINPFFVTLCKYIIPAFHLAFDFVVSLTYRLF